VQEKYQIQFQAIKPISPGQNVYFCKLCGRTLTTWSACRAAQVKVEKDLKGKPLFRELIGDTEAQPSSMVQEGQLEQDRPCREQQRNSNHDIAEVREYLIYVYMHAHRASLYITICSLYITLI
jgi:hypothetical protein